jgi:small subunit ribosomal protein S4
MTKRAESKYKINRRLGENLWGRAKSPVARARKGDQGPRTYGPGQHGQRRKNKPTDFGIQLMAKQKLKGYYGNIGEKQFRKYYDEAVRRKGDTSENLIELLERRLDTVIYRMKFAVTPFAARQFVNHGHVTVNGKRVNIPSYLVRDEDVVEVKEKSKGLTAVLDAVQEAGRDVPEYLEADHRQMKGRYLRAAKFSDVPYPVVMEPNLVVEFYSR